MGQTGETDVVATFNQTAKSVASFMGKDDHE
jgi:hypothetical protein